MTPDGAKKTILVLGNVNSDLVLYPGLEVPKGNNDSGQSKRRWDEESFYQSFRTFGGADLTREFVVNALTGTRLSDKGWNTVGYNEKVLKENQDAFVESVIELARFAKAPGKKDEVFRVSRIIGWSHRKNRDEAKTAYDAALEKVLGTLGAICPRILVLHDSNNGFRDRVIDKIKPFLARNPRFKAEDCEAKDRGVIVWQIHTPVHNRNDCASIDWRMFADYSKQTVVIVRLSCLQKAGFGFRPDASAEQLAEDFFRWGDQLKIHLPPYRHLIIRFFNGALHLDSDSKGGGPDVSFFPYVDEDPLIVEKKGFMFGSTSILTAGIVAGMIAKNGDIGAVAEGLRQGLRMAKAHYREGFDPEDVAGDWSRHRILKGEDVKAGAHASGGNGVAPEKKGSDEDELATVRFPLREKFGRRWSRIVGIGESEEEIQAMAVRIVKFGIEKGLAKDKSATDSTGDSPFAQFGKIRTVDRHEIDRLSSIQALMHKYYDKKDWDEPLSIAVFGQPGSGKSFTAKQILSTVDREAAKRALEFNIAQLTGIADLATAFHQAQDRALAGDVPLVVFDEFDSAEGDTELGWLKYFLAPMQDGRFKDGNNVYRVGRAILLFVGGTSHCFRDFEGLHRDNPEWRRARKLPDFTSRLRGHLDIAGIHLAGAGALGSEDTQEQVIIRRAILLRALIEEKLGGIVDRNTKEARIDKELIKALVTKAEYKHGVRSLQAILEMAVITFEGDSSQTFQMASIAPKDQLEMHVENVDVIYGSPPTSIDSSAV